MQRGPIQSQMVCQDARRAFPYMVAGEIPLTEWALLERHVGNCDECRVELDRLREQAAALARARQRQTRRSVMIATTALVVIVGAGLYVQQYGMPPIPRPESFRFSTQSPGAPPTPSAPPASPAPPGSSAVKPRPAPAASTQPTDLPPATSRSLRSAPTATPAQVGPRPGPAGEPAPSSRLPSAAKPTPPPAPKPDIVAKPTPAPKPEVVAKPAPPPPAPVSPPVVKPSPAPAAVAAPAPSPATATAPDERMPTQGSTGRVIHAAPTAETMPTQGQPPTRSRP